MHLQVPLKNLKFGHEAPTHPGNARVTGREDGIAELAAHIHARGKIDDLLVYDDGVEEIYFVANGNRSLAALRMIYGETSSEPVDCKLTTAEQAYEDSLAVAVLARKFHPVDEYEGFARLQELGKTEEEIARQYGKTEREVEQVLALGHLSPNIREAWRKGEIKAAAAKAFTLAHSHKAQDEALAQLRGEMENDRFDFDDEDVKEILKIDQEGGALVEFIGIDSYVAKGGKVTLDLFGTDHRISDVKLAKKMADEKLADECNKLKDSGWSFAVTKASVRNNHWQYGRLKAEGKPTDDEQVKLDQLEAIFLQTEAGSFDSPIFKEMTAAQQQAFLDHRELERTIKLGAFTPAMMAKAGCFVELNQEGMLHVDYGRVKPAQKEKAAAVEKQEKKEQAKAAKKTAKAEGKPEPAPTTTLSNALKERLEMWLVAATRDAIAGEPLLVNSPLFELLAKIACAQIVADRPHGMPDALRTKLPSLRQVLNPAVFNAALYKRFDAENYFSNAPRGLVIKAIAEAVNPDEARKMARKSKADTWKFALANLGKTGWLPKELRTVHYKGPGSEGYKRPAAPPSAPKPDLATAMGDALAKAEKALKPLKRAAAVRKAASKAMAKKHK